MFHPDTQFLIDFWLGLARRPDVRGGLPARSALEPEVLGARLPRAFILEGAGPEARFRLAGSWLETFRDGPLAGAGFAEVWCDASSMLVAPALAQSLREARPVVIFAQQGEEAQAVEVSVAPLRESGGRAALFIGLVAPAARPEAANTAGRLTARLTIAVGDRGRPALSLVEGRRSA